MTLTVRLISVLLGAELLATLFLSNVAFGDNIPNVRKDPYKHWRMKIQCQACLASTKQFAREAKKLKEKIGKKKIRDEDYENLVDRVCHPYKDEGLWITTFDLAKEPPFLKMVPMGDIGKCNRECETIGYTCKKTLGKSVPEVLDVIHANHGKIDGKEIKDVVCEIPCEKEKRDVRKESNIGYEEWEQTDAEHLSLMRMLVEKHEEESGKKIGGYTMDELNMMVEQQELKKQYEADIKQKRRKRRKRLYGEDYVDPEEIKEAEEAAAKAAQEATEAAEAVEVSELVDEVQESDVKAKETEPEVEVKAAAEATSGHNEL